MIWIYSALEISLLSDETNESPEFEVNLWCLQYGNYFDGKQYGNECYWYLMQGSVKIIVTEKTPTIQTVTCTHRGLLQKTVNSINILKTKAHMFNATTAV